MISLDTCLGKQLLAFFAKVSSHFNETSLRCKDPSQWRAKTPLSRPPQGVFPGLQAEYSHMYEYRLQRDSYTMAENVCANHAPKPRGSWSREIPRRSRITPERGSCGLSLRTARTNFGFQKSIYGEMNGWIVCFPPLQLEMLVRRPADLNFKSYPREMMISHRAKQREVRFSQFH